MGWAAGVGEGWVRVWGEGVGGVAIYMDMGRRRGRLAYGWAWAATASLLFRISQAQHRNSLEVPWDNDVDIIDARQHIDLCFKPWVQGNLSTAFPTR